MLALDKVLAHTDTTLPRVLATLVKLEGSGFRIPGARMLIFDDGTHTGSISGGCLEKDVARMAFALAAETPVRALYDTRADAFHPAGQYGTGCDGVVHVLLQRLPIDDDFSLLARLKDARLDRRGVTVATVHAGPGAVGGCAILDGHVSFSTSFPEAIRDAVSAVMSDVATEREPCQLEIDDRWEVLVEFIAPRPRVVIVGHGDDAFATARLAKETGWDVTVCGRDPLRLDRFDLPTQTLTNDQSFPIVDSATAVVFMSHNFELDAQFLPAVLAQAPPYIGVLGPRKRAAKLLTSLVQSGISIDLAKRPIHAPIGLNLGSDEPSHIALSVISEIVAKLHDRDGGMISQTKPDFIQKRLPIRRIES